MKEIGEGCPHALQITDRWHLFHTWAQKIEGFLKRSFPRYIPAYVVKSYEQRLSRQKCNELNASEKKKWELIRQVQMCYKKGQRKAGIIRGFSIDRKKTLNKYLQLKKPPNRTRRGRYSVDPYCSIILKILRTQTTVNHIFSVIREQGI